MENEKYYISKNDVVFKEMFLKERNKEFLKAL